MKEKQKQYRYSSLEDGCKYVQSYESMTEVNNEWYNGKSYSLYRTCSEFHKLPDGSFVSHYRIGRDELRKKIRNYYDPTIYERVGDREIELYNSNGDLVGSVKNLRILKSIIEGNLYTAKVSLINSAKKGLKKSPHFGNLTYKYK